MLEPHSGGEAILAQGVGGSHGIVCGLAEWPESFPIDAAIASPFPAQFFLHTRLKSSLTNFYCS
jgi:hypothetical protein